MGTHPIFESDFDCLTENVADDNSSCKYFKATIQTFFDFVHKRSLLGAERSDRLNQEVIKDDEIGTVESVKSVATIYAPLSGTVHEVNKAICPDSGKPQLINRDPFGKGWILKMVVNDDSEVSSLMTEEQYIQYLKEEDLITAEGDPKTSS